MCQVPSFGRKIENMTTRSNGLAGKELLLEVACDLFTESGYDGVSMQQIAEAAHMTKGSPYYHFAGKEDLFAQAFVNRVDQIHEGLMRALGEESDLETRLINALSYLLSTADAGVIRLVEDFKRCVGTDLATKCQAQRLAPEEMVARYTLIFTDAANTGVSFRVPPEHLALFFFSLQMGMLHSFHIMNRLPPSAAEIRQFAAEAVMCFLHGATESAAAATSF